MIDRRQAEMIRRMFPVGKRVKLLFMNDIQAVPSGTLGTVDYVDDIGTIHVNWDNGSTLGLVYGEDKFEIINKKSMIRSDER